MGLKNKSSEIHDRIYKAICDGLYKEGDRLPTEVELAKSHKVSRPTVAKALLDLQRKGLVERRVGSGTFVGAYTEEKKVRPLFGLLIPHYHDTEIFQPILIEISRLAEIHGFSLLWSGSGENEAEQDQRSIEKALAGYIEQGVDGVFITPFELASWKDSVNQRMVATLQAANIPAVMIDRDITSYPKRSRYDVVSLNNFLAGYEVASHLIDCGCKRVVFIAKARSAPTASSRIAGCSQALLDASLSFDPKNDVLTIPSDDKGFLDSFATLVRQSKDLGMICLNDATAASVMHGLDQKGIQIPKDVKMAGIDDVNYAKHLRVPLTSYRQPCSEIALLAVRTLLSRISDPSAPSQEILLQGKLIIRQSTRG